ncbi:MAG TPA: zinc-ribbon domain-containing protein [Terrimicrobiaceae bacterium]
MTSHRNHFMALEYRDFVTHPRYGQGPRITGLNPETDYAARVFLHWHSPKGTRIPNTAIPADLSRQSPATVPVTHYFDVKRQCRDCGKPFIFFAAEQKYWYEDLGFGLDSDCVRCVVCRKKQQGIGLKRERYEELFHVADRTTGQNLEMAECCLSLVESDVFHKRQLPHIRGILKRLPPGSNESEPKVKNLWERLHALERDDG